MQVMAFFSLDCFCMILGRTLYVQLLQHIIFQINLVIHAYIHSYIDMSKPYCSRTNVIVSATLIPNKHYHI